MKKSLIALAAFAATSAFAQSSVTLYGIVEAGADIGYSKVTDTVVTNAAGVVTSNTRVETKNGFRVQDGNDQGTGTSRVGFRGTEDLGGGLKANFLLEMGLRLDDGSITANGTNVPTSGNSGGNAFGRNAWGGVSGGFGEVRIGRQVLGSFGVQASSWSAGSSNGLYDAGSGTAPLMGGVRFSNAIRYLSPTMGGFKASVMLAAPETEAATSTTTTVPAATPTTTAKRRTGVDLALEYANGPVYVGFGYNLRDAANDTTNVGGAGNTAIGGKITGYTLGGSYNMGVVQPFLNYTRENTQTGGVAGAVVTNGDTTARAWSIGLRAPIGAFTVIAGVGRVVTSNVTTATALPNATSEAKRNAYQIGAQYALSKRTLVQANYGQNKLDQTAVANTLISTRTNDKVSALNVGLKHSF